jgi:hypothetical protein
MAPDRVMVPKQPLGELLSQTGESNARTESIEEMVDQVGRILWHSSRIVASLASVIDALNDARVIAYAKYRHNRILDDVGDGHM